MKSFIGVPNGHTFWHQRGAEMAFQISFGEGSRERPSKLTMEVKWRRRRKFFELLKKRLKFSLFSPRFLLFFLAKGGGANARSPPPYLRPWTRACPSSKEFSLDARRMFAYSLDIHIQMRITSEYSDIIPKSLIVTEVSAIIRMAIS